MDVETGTLIKLKFDDAYTDADGNIGIVLKVTKDFFVASDWLFKIFFFENGEIRWYKRANLEIVA
jgi:hypothetical protein